ncbi:MAG: alpha/beta hydrolase [Hamadaea sp.]|nr:alpha/beta hydrolase [Hamadaea sp.]
MTEPTWVLMHSPLLGPSSWRPVASVLAARGHAVVVPDATGALREGPPFGARIVARVVAQLRSRPVVLIGHSRAGPLLPAIADAVGPEVAGLVFVDARLPHPGESALTNMPAEAAERLRALAVDGMLPPWHEWFAPSTLADLIADPAVRAALTAEVTGVPFAFFTEPASPAVWPGPTGYLLLSESYRADAATARIRDTAAVVELPSHHLSMVTAPARMADALERLLAIMLAA